MSQLVWPFEASRKGLMTILEGEKTENSVIYLENNCRFLVLGPFSQQFKIVTDSTGIFKIMLKNTLIKYWQTIETKYFKLFKCKKRGKKDRRKRETFLLDFWCFSQGRRHRGARGEKASPKDFKRGKN